MRFRFSPAGLGRKIIQYRYSKFIGLAAILIILLILRVWLSGSFPASPDSRSSLLPTLKKTDKPDISQFGLDIPQLDVWAPIIPDVDGYNKDIYLKKIENGVAQFSGTKNPDQNGNLFIFGHSKYYPDKPGDYKEVFRELDKLQKGDKLSIYYQGIKYSYKVNDSKKVPKTDWSIMDPTPDVDDDKTLTIMTCWPAGTLDARWAVFATQI